MIFIIPARGGSKRIPRKNMQEIAGKTLMEWALLKVRGNGHPYVVATDDDEVAKLCDELHAPVFWRRPVSDEQNSAEVVRQVLAASADKSWVLVEPTAPFIGGTTITKLRTGLLGGCARQRVGVSGAIRTGLSGGCSRQCVGVSGPSGFRRVGVYGGNDTPQSNCWANDGHPQLVHLVSSDEGLDINTPEDLENARRMAVENPGLLKW